jgi:hypothetical protein
VPENLGQQRLQKVRRAQRLIQVCLRNRDVLFNGKFGRFGRVVFPLKLLMVVVCPLLMLFGVALVGAYVVLAQNMVLYVFSLIALVSVILGAFLFRRLGLMVSSFVFHQLYLIAGLVTSLRKSVYWKTIERK